MKSGIERFRQLKADQEKKIAAAEEALDALRMKREDLETRINSAIKDGDQVTAGKLIRDRIDADVQIEIAEKTLSMLDVSLDRAAVAVAWKEDLADYQKQIDKVEKDMNQLIRQTVEKALAIADLVNASWDARTSALRLVEDQEPHTFNGGNTDFPGISFPGTTIEKVKDLYSSEERNKIRSDAAGTIDLALRSRTNIYFHRR